MLSACAIRFLNASVFARCHSARQLVSDRGARLLDRPLLDMRSQRQGGRICRLYVQQVFRLWIGRTSFPSPTGLTFSLPVGLAFYCVCEKITCRFSPESWRIAAFALVHSILVRKRGIAGRVHVNVRKVRVNVAWRTWWFVCLLWCTWLPIRTKSTLISSESTAK